MALIAGSRLGPYEVVAAIGAGGMGEVYRARDTRLDREVAIKVLPDGFARDPDRRLRFEREAKAIATLSHPNVLSIFDTGEHDGHMFVVTELLSGETLRERLTKTGPLQLRKAIDTGIQIARGLAAAHEKGLVHRDLKPENVFLLADGQLKILDFGLARQAVTNTGMTETAAVLTDAGTVMGTVGYMAPEQVRGQAVDARADLFALGAVLYEALSGARAFAGDTVADTMIALVREDPPDLTHQRQDVPPGLERIIRHCLEKNASERFQTARDIAFALEALSNAAASGSTAAVSQQPGRRSGSLFPWAVAGLAVISAAGLAIWPLRRPAQKIGDPLLVTVPIPNEVSFGAELSPDGRRMAAIGLQLGKPTLWVREMETAELKPLAGPVDPNGLFWFPDSESIGVHGDGKLQRIRLSGGPPQLIADRLGGSFGGASANTGGMLLYTKGFITGPIYRRSLTGRDEAAATTLNAAREEIAHLWPQFLPDGNHFLYLSVSRKPELSGIYAGALDSMETRLIVPANVRGVFAAPDILLTVREGALMAQHFDLTLRSLTGQAQLLANSIDTFTGYGSAAITASSTGLLAYSDSGLLEIKNSQLLWRERNGAILGAFDERRDYQMVNLSKDDARLAIGLQSPTTRTADVWIGDVARNNMSQFAASSAGEYDPQWSGPASDRIAFTLDRARLTGLAVKSVIDAGEPRKLFESDEVAALGDWSVDGRYILYQLLNGAQIYALPMSGEDRTPIRVLDSPSTKDQERLSPDGKWMAYNANDSGRFEVYVVSFPIAGRPIPVSIDGGVQPRWRRDMKELFYLAPDGMLMAVDVVQTATDLEFRTPHPLFQTGLVSPSMGWEQYDVTRDGQKFIVITPPAERPARGVNLLLNWQTKIK